MRWPWQPLVDDTGRPGLTLGELFIVFLVGVLAFVTAAPAQGRGITVDCRELAFTIGTVVWARTMKAERERVLADVRRRAAMGGQARADAIAREARIAWHAGQPMEESMRETYRRCQERRGDIGTEG